MNWKQGTLGALAGAGVAAWAISSRASHYKWRDKVVLITGGSRGLGLQLAREFGSKRARVVICARDHEELEAARKDLTAQGVRVRAIPCDVGDPNQVANLVSQAGPIDVLVNNAGVIQVAPVEDLTMADFEQAMSVIFWGTVNTTLAVLPHMRERRAGRIVNISSIGGKVSIPHLLPYSCAKFAVTGFSEGLRAELLKDGIKVVTISPGLMRTGSHLQAYFKGQHELEYQWFSLGAATPFVSISAERAAKAIVRATERGDAEKILSVPADILAKLHDAFPAILTEVLGLVNQHLLPENAGGGTANKSGHEAARGLASVLFEAVTAMGRRAAEQNNETLKTA